MVQWSVTFGARSRHCHQVALECVICKGIVFTGNKIMQSIILNWDSLKPVIRQQAVSGRWSWQQDATKCYYHLCNTELPWTAICQNPVSRFIICFRKLLHASCICSHRSLVSSPRRCGENQWAKAQKEDRQPRNPLSQPGNHWARPHCHPEWWHWSR